MLQYGWKWALEDPGNFKKIVFVVVCFYEEKAASCSVVKDIVIEIKQTNTDS